jgi:hypothetical protein
MNTKKILMYGGGAIVVGAVTYFVWAFFQKPVIPIGNTTIALGSNKNEEEKDVKPMATNTSSGTKFDFTPMDFKPIEIPNIYANINNFPLSVR